MANIHYKLAEAHCAMSEAHYSHPDHTLQNELYTNGNMGQLLLAHQRSIANTIANIDSGTS